MQTQTEISRESHNLFSAEEVAETIGADLETVNEWRDSCCGLRSRDVRQPSGWPDRSLRPSPGHRRRAIWCAIMTLPMDMSLPPG